MLRDVENIGGFQKRAAQEIAKEASGETGISLYKHITTTLQPLYRLRTSTGNSWCGGFTRWYKTRAGRVDFTNW